MSRWTEIASGIVERCPTQATQVQEALSQRPTSTGTMRLAQRGGTLPPLGHSSFMWNEAHDRACFHIIDASHSVLRRSPPQHQLPAQGTCESFPAETLLSGVLARGAILALPNDAQRRMEFSNTTRRKTNLGGMHAS